MLRRVALLIGEIFRRNAAVVPHAPAASMDGRVLSWAELDRAGNRTARALAALGVGHGDRIVSWCDTALDVLPLFAGAAKCGAVFAPLNARLGVAEATDVIALARPALLVADAERAEGAAVAAKSAGVPSLARLGGAGPGTDLIAAAAAQDGALWAEPRLRETDPHVIFFTSGSTGKSKGVVLSHRANYLRGFQGVFRDVPEKTVCMFPLFHMAAFTLALAAWQTRGEIALVAPPTAEKLLDAVQARRANRLYCIPAVWRRILEVDLSRWDLSSLHEVDTGTSATPIELIRELKARFPGTRTRIYYGSTEAGAAAMLDDADVLRKPGSVGRAQAGVDLELLPSGEIRVRSDYLMDGYFENPAATAESLVEGWYHTGDLGAFDADGCLSIVGRARDIIRSGGESIAPTEVEVAIATHPCVAECAVVGIPDASWGEIVCAAVVLRPGSSLTLPELQAHCAPRLARFKQPRRLETVEELPRTAATRQVQRTLLVERIQALG
jgi:acyl-CoA synthetase (AMP-forming)/AMP-acid ligase II